MSWNCNHPFVLLTFAGFVWSPLQAATLSSEQQQCVARGHRFERHGWIYLHVEGGPKERGLQHGYLLAPEIAEGVRATRATWEYQSGMTWTWLVEHAGAMFVPRVG